VSAGAYYLAHALQSLAAFAARHATASPPQFPAQYAPASALALVSTQQPFPPGSTGQARRKK
ncbi:hypothetical protein ACQQ69_02870, partial [Corynebacterium diphtheriae]